MTYVELMREVFLAAGIPETVVDRATRRDKRRLCILEM